MDRDQFTFYRSFWEAIRGLPKKGRQEALEAVIEYALYEKAPNLSGVPFSVFTLIRPTLDASRNKAKNRQNKTKTKEEQNGNEGEKESKGESKSKRESKSKNECYIESADADSCADAEKAPPKKEGIPYAEIVAYLNEKAGAEYRASTTKTRTCIHARWEEGFRLEDFKTVIARKCADWKGTDMGKFLRPETLFGTKFEGYLNEGGVAKKPGSGRRELDQEEAAAIRRMLEEDGNDTPEPV